MKRSVAKRRFSSQYASIAKWSMRKTMPQGIYSFDKNVWKRIILPNHAVAIPLGYLSQ